MLKAQPSVVRKHVGFWVSQGLLKEQSTDVYAVVQEQKLAHKGIMTRECCTIHYVSRLYNASTLKIHMDGRGPSSAHHTVSRIKVA